MAAEEKDVTAEIISVAAADGVKFEKPMDKISVRKLWVACRRIMKGASTPSNSMDDAFIPEDVDTDMGASWSRLHNFMLPDSMLLIKTLQGKLWRGVAAAPPPPPPQLDVYLAEALRPLSCMDKSVQQSLAIVPGKAPEVVTAVVDQVTKPMELWIRVRAFFMTLAYVSIKTPGFFSYQSAVFVSENMFARITNTFRGQPAPTSFFITAWAATAHHFSEQVRVSKISMNEIVTNTGAYENRWLSYQPADAVYSTSGSSSSNADLPYQVQEELNRLRESTNRFQAERDTARQALRDRQTPPHHSSPNTNGKGKNSDAKGGKGKGGSRRKRRNSGA